MVERACSAMEGLSAERTVAVKFAARLGAVGAIFMQHADSDGDTARHAELKDEARAILRGEGRRKRQIWRRSRASEAKRARGGDQAEHGPARSRPRRRGTGAVEEVEPSKS